ncbi:dTMP kinase [Patescibacteria group bacterium]|nr:dTMP kinase [Patescibacteria group bacterium]MBU1029099.1 dTMP kinase [Patescibacteria group bacterium]MBU1916005.1 dTMP kinase [Patescibacteria group bacterium]
MATQHGKFIVIEGTDGSGKQTQADLLVKRLQALHLPVVTFAFPQYGQKSAGMVEEYLAGKYGTPEEVGPYRASIFYAVDRYAISHKIRAELAFGRHVVCDRYVASNLGHQGSKLRDATERFNYYRWVMELEFGLFGIPKPDRNIILHVPAETTLQLIENRGQTKDAHEADPDHLRAAERTYLEITQNFTGYTLIECAPKGNLLTREAIHELTWAAVTPLLQPAEQTTTTIVK